MKKYKLNLVLPIMLGLLLIGCQRKEAEKNANVADQLTEETISDLLSQGVFIDTDEDGNNIYITPFNVGTPQFIKKQKEQVSKELGLSALKGDKKDALEQWFKLMNDLGGETERLHFNITSASLKTRTHRDPDTDVSTSFWFTQKTLSREVVLSLLKWGYDRMKDNNIRQWRIIPYQLIGVDKSLGGGWDRSNKGKEMTGVRYLNIDIARTGAKDDQDNYYMQTAFPSNKRNRRPTKYFAIN